MNTDLDVALPDLTQNDLNVLSMLLTAGFTQVTLTHWTRTKGTAAICVRQHGEWNLSYSTPIPVGHIVIDIGWPHVQEVR